MTEIIFLLGNYLSFYHKILEKSKTYDIMEDIITFKGKVGDK